MFLSTNRSWKKNNTEKLKQTEVMYDPNSRSTFVDIVGELFDFENYLQSTQPSTQT